MVQKQLPWQNISFDNFELLSLHFLQSMVSECKFEPFLKQGNKQGGIDLLSSTLKDDKYVTAQCKKVRKLTVSELDDIIDEFTHNNFISVSSRFILITPADTQTAVLKSHIIKYQAFFKEKYDIVFECWDMNFLNEQLRYFHSLVAVYFSPEVADSFCFARVNNTAQNFKKIESYIERSIKKFKRHSFFEYNFHDSEKLSRLEDLFIKDRLVAQRICLIGDAHQGKSLLLNHTAFTLQNCDIPYVPFLLEIKKFSIRPIKEILNIEFGQWKRYPAKDVLIIIDGLDEVPTESFDTVVRYVNEFALEYHYLNIVTTCRKIFFSHYKVNSILQKFDVYDLVQLQHDEINGYIKRMLTFDSTSFIDLVNKKRLGNILYHPFYLVNIIFAYRHSPNEFPYTKVEIIESFIDKSYNQSKERRINNGQRLDHKIVRFRETMKRFAFALQLAGTNSFDATQIQEIFKAEEQELLQHSSLISVTNDNWSFSNALFQEHLAALVLAEAPKKSIIEYISVGRLFKKVKTKWIQTVSSLIAIVDEGSDIHKAIVRFIENDNIEILFTTEKTKYSVDMRFRFLKLFIQKCIKYNIRSMIVHEEDIATFVDGDNKASEYLISILAHQELSEIVKIESCRILIRTSLNERLRNEYLEVALREIALTENSYYAAQIVEGIQSFQLGTNEIIVNLISHQDLISQHHYRNSVYELITTLNLNDTFYELGLLGLPVLAEHNRKISHSFSENGLLNFLTNTNSRGNLSKLYSLIADETWIKMIGYRNETQRLFFKNLVETSVRVFGIDPYVIFDVCNYIRILGRKYLRDDFKEIDVFFDNTDSYWLALRILLSDIVGTTDTALGEIITEKSYDYIFFEFEEGNYYEDFLHRCWWSLRRSTQDQQADDFIQLCRDVVGSHFNNSNEARSRNDEYILEQQIKKKNDLVYIVTKTKFKNGVIKYFKAYGKDIIPDEDLFVDYTDQNVRQKSDSNFVASFLIPLIHDFRFVRLNDCLNNLDNDNYFDDFRAEQIMEYQYLNEEEIKGILLPILEAYYQKAILTADFRKAAEDPEIDFWRSRESLLCKIFQKFLFKTPGSVLMEMIWMDIVGIRGFKHHDTNKSRSLCHEILDNLSSEEKYLFKRKIVSNIKSGILNPAILGTHVGLCRHLVITEAKESLLKVITEQELSSHYLCDVVDVYLELKGDTSQLLPVFERMKDYEDYLYFHLVQILSSGFSTEVIKSLKLCLKKGTTQEIKITAAKYLSQLGVKEGFAFLCDLAKSAKKSPYSIQGRMNIQNVDTKFGLNIIGDSVLKMLEKDDEEIRFSDSSRSLVIEWIYAFAAKSEHDLNLVVEFLRKKQVKFAASVSNSKDLFWFAERAIENFRDSDKTKKSTSEIKAVLSTL